MPSDGDWDGGNWLSTVNASVLDNAVALIEFRDSAEWLDHAKTAFETNVLRDIREDGKEIENSTGYVQFAYTSMFSVLKTLTERGVSIDPEVRRRLDLLQDFLAWCAWPNLSMPTGHLPKTTSGVRTYNDAYSAQRNAARVH